MTHQKTAEKASYFSIIGNLCLALVKGLAGFWGNSYALIADAIESTSDIFSSLLVLFGIKYANKPADLKHPYGHGRIEPLVTFVVVGLLIGSALIIAIESIQNIRTPHELPKSWTLFVLILVILWKEYSFQVVIAKANSTNSSSLKADAWHHRSDAITSVAAFIGISVAIVMGKGYEWADDVAALCASVLIVYNSFRIFKPALGEIMDEQIDGALIDDIRKISLTVQGIKGTEKCLIRKAGMQYHVDLHALVDASITVKDGHDLAHQLKDTLKNKHPELGHILIHVEPFVVHYNLN